MEKAVLFSLCSAVMILAVKKYHADYALLISVVAGTVLLGFCAGYLAPLIDVIRDYSSEFSFLSFPAQIILRAVSIAYIGRFASDICSDAGESSLASKIDALAKIMISSLSIPVMVSLFENLMEIAGGL